MPASTLTMGADAVCTDGVCGDVSRVVVDPIAQVVTHLVIEPKYRRGLGRLVPLDLVDTTTEAVRLRCTLSDFDRLEIAEETQFLPGSMGYANYGPGQSLAWPYYGLGSAFVGDDVGFGVGNVAPPVTIDVLPAGEVAVRRGEHVHATDADIGKVQGVVIDPHNRHVTHVLLQEGHLWGRKEVAIPIGAVQSVDDGIRLNLTKQQVQDLPAIDVTHPLSAGKVTHA
ncbi:MAG: PRC-barrel domain-containing protein [Acidimicrobiia bacterium]